MEVSHRGGDGSDRLQKSKLVAHGFRVNRGDECQQPGQQAADVSFVGDKHAGMGATFRQIPTVQSHEMADVVCQQHAPLAGREVQDRGVVKTLEANVVNAEGIDAVPTQLRCEVGIDILVDEEGYADCPRVP